MDSRYVVLRRYPARIHADLAKSALDAAEIFSIVRGDDPRGLESDPVPHSDVELIVSEEDAEMANEILGDEEKFST